MSACLPVPDGYNTVMASDSTGLAFVSSSLLFYASSWAPVVTKPLPAELPALNVTLSDAWVAATTYNQEYLVMDIGYNCSVWGIITQGRSSPQQWVTQYDAYGSNDTVTWSLVASSLAGNINGYEQVVQWVPFVARYVKLVPTAYYGSSIAMRAGLMLSAPLYTIAPMTNTTGLIAICNISSTGNHTYSQCVTNA